MAESDDAINNAQKPKQAETPQQKAEIKKSTPEPQQPKQTTGQNKADVKAKAQSDIKTDKTTPPKKSAGHKKAAAPRERKHSFPIVGSVALILAIAVALASYYNYIQWQSAQSQGTALVSENAQLRSELNDLQSRLKQLQLNNSNLGEQSNAILAEQKWVKEAINQVSEQVQAVAADKGKDPLLWRLAEVDYLLTVANNRLLLERDVSTALLALQDADARLESIADPALIPIRKLIAGETSALNSVDMPDIPGMAVRLSSLVDSIERLPLVSRDRVEKTQPADGDTPVVENFQQFMDKILQDLKGIVTIRRSDQPIEPLLPPDEQHYLAQNLGLKLEESRIALLRGDTAAFRQHLSDTQDWVQRYFDPDSSSVNNVITTVTELQTTELRPNLPDISASLRELRRWVSLHQQNNSTAQHNSTGHNEG